MVFTGSVMEARIQGEFSGWHGESVYQLTNGQIWQQASYQRVSGYRYHPAVLIYKTQSGYRMKVEGSGTDVAVRQLLPN